jgi:hypothetical protein
VKKDCTFVRRDISNQGNRGWISVGAVSGSIGISSGFFGRRCHGSESEIDEKKNIYFGKDE